MSEGNNTVPSFQGVAVCVVALTLAGCVVNPLVSWTPPTPARTEVRTLDRGRDFSNAARTAYQAKLSDQVGANAALQSGLIGLGAIVLALAAGNAHRDAILGTTLVGATAFSLGAWNFDKRRLLIYSGAVAALNCADRAVAPLDMSKYELDQLESALGDMAFASADVTAGANALEFELTTWVARVPAAANQMGPYKAAIDSARQAVAAAASTQASGEMLRYQSLRASDRLIDATRKIDQEANAALLETAGDLNKIPGVIAGLAGIAGSLAPGSHVEATLADSLKNAGGAQAAAGAATVNQALSVQSRPPASLVAASQRLADAVRRLYRATSLVLGKVRPLGDVLTLNALADCGIGPISVAMAISPAKLSFPTGVRSEMPVTISGGKAPYAVKPNGALVEGVTIAGPDRFGASFEVRVAATVTKAQSAGFVILDSSDPTRSLPFAVEVAAPPASSSTQGGNVQAPKKPTAPGVGAGAGAGGAGAGPAVATGADADALVALRNAKPFELQNVKVDYSSPPRRNADGSFEVFLGCTPATPPACLKQEDLRAAFAGVVPTAAKPVIPLVRFSNIKPDRCACTP